MRVFLHINDQHLKSFDAEMSSALKQSSVLQTLQSIKNIRLKTHKANEIYFKHKELKYLLLQCQREKVAICKTE